MYPRVSGSETSAFLRVPRWLQCAAKVGDVTTALNPGNNHQQVPLPTDPCKEDAPGAMLALADATFHSAQEPYIISFWWTFETFQCLGDFYSNI